MSVSTSRSDVLVWDEDGNRQRGDVYPYGVGAAVADALRAPGRRVRLVGLDQADAGLSAVELDSCDCLVWWAHERHDEVPEPATARAVAAVLAGTGLVVLHSAVGSALFRTLVGSSAGLGGWRHGDREVLWPVAPDHPIMAGVRWPIVLAESEMYAEPFDVPAPDELLAVSWFAGGEAFRSAMTFRRGRGRIVVLTPGHEAYPIYHHPEIRRLLAAAVTWAMRPAPTSRIADGPERARGWFEVGA